MLDTVYVPRVGQQDQFNETPLNENQLNENQLNENQLNETTAVN